MLKTLKHVDIAVPEGVETEETPLNKIEGVVVECIKYNLGPIKVALLRKLGFSEKEANFDRISIPGGAKDLALGEEFALKMVLSAIKLDTPKTLVLTVHTACEFYRSEGINISGEEELRFLEEELNLAEKKCREAIEANNLLMPEIKKMIMSPEALYEVV